MSLPTDVAPAGHYSWSTDLSFTDADTRTKKMEATVDEWFQAFQHNLPTPMGLAQLDDWLRMQARLPYASVRNTLLLCGQHPTATELRTYDGWAAASSGPDAPHLRGASAIWIWDPVVARQCPGCGRGHYAHDVSNSDDTVECTDIDPGRWEYGIVDTTPTALFARDQWSDGFTTPPDDSQKDATVSVRPPTAGPNEHRPDLSEDASRTPDPGRLPKPTSPAALLECLKDLAEPLPLQLEFVDSNSYSFVEPAVVGTRDTYTLIPRVQADPQTAPSTLAAELLRDYSEVLVAPDISDHDELRRRRLEAEATAYAAAIALGHGSRLQIPIDVPTSVDQWGHDSIATLQTRCTRIRNSLAHVLEAAISTTHPTVGRSTQ